jgi:hypothetical protein
MWVLTKRQDPFKMSRRPTTSALTATACGGR